MKVATKRFLLGILAAVFAICVGFIISGNAHSAAYADDATVINLTMQNTQYQNNAENAGAYYTSLCFLHTDNHAEYGVSTGNYTSGTTPDYSDILSKTVYTGSENTVLYRSAVFWGWAADTKSSTFRFIYIGTVNAPAAGDRITISAGAWFITGGTINDKYVISTDIILEFDGSAWVYYAPFTLGNDLWSGADQSGGKGVQLTAWGIENDGNAAAYPTAGTFALLNSGVFAAGPTANQASNITGIKYNGTPIKDVAGAVVAEWFTYLALYVPYRTGLITVEKGTVIGSCYAADDFVYVLAETGGHGRMSVSAPFNITGILWNGSDMSGSAAVLNGYGIEHDGGDAALPLTGTCVLLNTDAALGHNITDNLAFTVGATIKYSDGTVEKALSGTDGAVVGLFANYLFIYVPERSGLITVESGTTVGTNYTDNDYYFILNEHSNRAVWTQAQAPQVIDGEWVDLYGKQEVKFSCVNYTWNNVRDYASDDARLVRSILDFDYTDENRPETSEGETAPILWLGKAASTTPSAVAKWITVNGVKLSEISGAYVDYSQGFNHMYIVMPESALIPTAEYPVAKLAIKANAVFEDSVLPELTLTLIGGAWVVGEFGQYGLPADGYKTVSDIAVGGELKVSAGGTYTSVLGEGDADFRFVLSSDSLIKNGAPSGYLSLYLKSTEDKSWDGFRFEFCFDYTTLRYVVNVYDASVIVLEEVDAGGSGHKLLATAPVGLAAKDYASFAVKITEDGGTYDVIVVEDGLKIAEITGVEPRGEQIGDGVLVYSPTVNWTFYDYIQGDVSAPYISLQTREIYFLEEGDAEPEISYRVYDRTDLPTDVSVEIIKDEDAATDGKMNAGQWAYVIRATDRNGNITEKTVEIYVSGERKFTITFDGKNAAEYVFGSLIAKPEDPEKAANDRLYYVFDGWYNGEHKWDFVNDTVYSDLNLVARFTEKDVLYKITFVGAGDGNSEVYAKYGAQIDTAFLNKDGYKTVLTVNGQNTETVIVRGETTVNVSYTKDGGKTDGDKKSGGCGSGIYSAYAIVPALLTTLCVMILRKKEN